MIIGICQPEKSADPNKPIGRIKYALINSAYG